MIPPQKSVAEPIWFPHRYDPSAGAIHFVSLSPEERRAATFLDDENLGAKPVRAVPVAQLTGFMSAASPSVHFIFHSAFCCSTLLVRALDKSECLIGFSEPKILNDLAAEAIKGQLRQPLLDLVLVLLCRSSGGEPVVIKPGNEANILMPMLLEARPAARALLLSSSLEDFLFSIAKKGMWGRLWVRRLYRTMHSRQSRQLGFSADESFQQTDLQIAALVWLMHRSEFFDVTARWPGRTRSLDSAELLAHKEAVLERVNQFMALGLLRGEVSKIATGEAFNAHSKQQERHYDAERREHELSRLRALHGEEISMVVSWTTAVAAHVGVPVAMTEPL